MSVYAGEGGASFGGDEVAPRGFSKEAWLDSVLFDMNIDPMVELGESSHPNTSLYSDCPQILEKVTDRGASRVSPYSGNPMPKVNPDSGVILTGNYGEEDLMISFDPSAFDLCNFTLLLRVFVDAESENVVTFGHSYRWLGLFKNRLTFNNQDQEVPVDSIKDNQWNEVMLSFSYNRDSNSGKCLLRVNENEINAPLNEPLSILEAGERTVSYDSGFSFVNYSNARCFKGIVGSAIVLNRACANFSELKQVGDLMLANHKKPSESFEAAKNVNVEVTEPHHIETEDEYNKLLKKNRLLVLDFFATWCGPCCAIAPKFSQLANKYKDAVFIKIDVDNLPSIMSKYQVNCMPTFVFIKDGSVIDRLEGADAKTLESKIKSLVELLQ